MEEPPSSSIISISELNKLMAPLGSCSASSIPALIGISKLMIEVGVPLKIFSAPGEGVGKKTKLEAPSVSLPFEMSSVCGPKLS